jgi:hypothetical protein
MGGERLALFGRKFGDAIGYATGNVNLLADRTIAKAKFEAFHVC